MNAQLICRFLKMTQGDWRNALWIGCSDCGQQCEILMTTDRDAIPIFIDAKLLQQFVREAISKEECVGSLSRQAVESIYAQWLLWEIDDPTRCALRTLAG